MVRVCAFPGCFNREKAIRLRPVASSQEESLTFHTLPFHDPERLKLWLLALKRDINSPIENIRALRVCSDHFSPDDLTGPTRRYLNSSAVPRQQTEVCVLWPMFEHGNRACGEKRDTFLDESSL